MPGTNKYSRNVKRDKEQKKDRRVTNRLLSGTYILEGEMDDKLKKEG